MRFAGNAIWFVFGGAIVALFWLLGALVFAISIIGLPLTRSAIEMAKLSAWPFGREVVHVRELDGRDVDAGTAFTGTFGFIFNLLWALTFGLTLCLSYIVIGVMWCITLIGIPFGLQASTWAGISLWPIGRRVVTKELAQRARDHAAEEKFNDYREGGKSAGNGKRRREPELQSAGDSDAIDQQPIIVARKPATPNRPALTADLPPQLKADLGWFVEVVGEANYQSELARAASIARPYEGHRLVVVTLRPESGNRHDVDAVRVDHRGETLGYLPRNAAREYRATLGTKGGAVTGSIVGGEGTDDSGDPMLFGIWLNLAWPPAYKQ